MGRRIGIISYIILFFAFVSIVDYFQIDVKGIVQSDVYQKVLIVGKNSLTMAYGAFTSVIEDLN